jgi:hypothetical protein
VEDDFMGVQRRRNDRVRFEYGYPARIVAIDGTWCRDCLIDDISETGAKISLSESVEGLNLGEFFLALSRTGTAHRRCRMMWLKGETIGVSFTVNSAPTDQKGKRATRRAAMADSSSDSGAI